MPAGVFDKMSWDWLVKHKLYWNIESKQPITVAEFKWTWYMMDFSYTNYFIVVHSKMTSCQVELDVKLWEFWCCLWHSNHSCQIPLSTLVTDSAKNLTFLRGKLCLSAKRQEEGQIMMTLWVKTFRGKCLPRTTVSCSLLGIGEWEKKIKMIDKHFSPKKSR